MPPPTSSLKNDNSSELEDTNKQEARPRREFVWARMEAAPGIQALSMPLHEIIKQFETAIDRHQLRKSGIRRLNHQPSLHKCTSYRKEEVILGPTMETSAILMSSSPSIHEVCFVCGIRVEAREAEKNEKEEEDERSLSSCRSYSDACNFCVDLSLKKPLCLMTFPT
jgi:hypothetical protein